MRTLLVSCLLFIGSLVSAFSSSSSQLPRARHHGGSISQSNDNLGNYAIQSVTPTAQGFSAILKVTSAPNPAYGSSISPLQADITFETADRVRIKIFDPNSARFEVPQSILPTPTPPTPASLNYNVSYTTYPAGFAVTRLSDSVVIFNTTSTGLLSGLVFEDQYLEISTQLPSQPNVYGLGERIDTFHRDGSGSNGHSYSFWARDNGTPRDANLYGSHPFHVEIRDGKAHGAFLKNANGLEVVLRDGSASPQGQGGFLTYKAIGGILDFYVFVGPGTEQLLKQYHELIGFPHLPPYWALGWHQCRWGYHTIQAVIDVVSNYSSHSIPLDTMWNDIDYMTNYEDFSYDPTRFPLAAVQSFVDTLHKNGQHYVVITDPGIHNRTGYAPYDQGLSKDIFVKDSNGQVYIGVVWPGTTAFPDWFHPGTTAYWGDQISTFLHSVPIDGLWIDMNECSNFNNQGSDQVSTEHSRICKYCTSKGHSPAFDPVHPPYAIDNNPNHSPLNTHALDTTVVHYGNIIEYNAHNLFGFMETIATRSALESLYNKRSLVISRSTFPGAGHHGGHWLGDNNSAYDDMKVSIAGLLDMNLFGIPLVGADVCGFGGDATEELCARWTELGAFYPFARNHNDLNATPQEPYVWPSVAIIAKNILSTRYQLLPYYYTLFYKAAISGGTVARSLAFEFPSDNTALKIDTQFLIGSGLLISPVLTQGATSVSAYLPPSAVWYDFWTYAPVTNTGFQTLPAPLDHIPLHLRGGVIIPLQTSALTTTASRQLPFYLIVPLAADGSATGNLYLDDGSTLNYQTESTYLAYTVSNGTLSSQVSSPKRATLKHHQHPRITASSAYPPLGELIVLGAPQPQHVCINGDCSAPFQYSAQTKTLIVVTNLQIDSAFSVSWQ